MSEIDTLYSNATIIMQNYLGISSTVYTNEKIVHFWKSDIERLRLFKKILDAFKTKSDNTRQGFRPTNTSYMDLKTKLTKLISDANITPEDMQKLVHIQNLEDYYIDYFKPKLLLLLNNPSRLSEIQLLLKSHSDDIIQFLNCTCHNFLGRGCSEEFLKYLNDRHRDIPEIIFLSDSMKKVKEYFNLHFNPLLKDLMNDMPDMYFKWRSELIRLASSFLSHDDLEPTSKLYPRCWDAVISVDTLILEKAYRSQMHAAHLIETAKYEEKIRMSREARSKESDKSWDAYLKRSDEHLKRTDGHPAVHPAVHPADWTEPNHMIHTPRETPRETRVLIPPKVPRVLIPPKVPRVSTESNQTHHPLQNLYDNMSWDSRYKEKYLKYKEKYLQLKHKN
jgi:hypothetical protein